MVLDHYLRMHPARKVVFIAPTQLLVLQQIEYIQRHSRTSPLRVAKLIGRDMDSWDEQRYDPFPPPQLRSLSSGKGSVHDLFVGVTVWIRV
jgi:hypothetical protein